MKRLVAVLTLFAAITPARAAVAASTAGAPATATVSATPFQLSADSSVRATFAGLGWTVGEYGAASVGGALYSLAVVARPGSPEYGFALHCRQQGKASTWLVTPPYRGIASDPEMLPSIEASFVIEASPWPVLVIHGDAGGRGDYEAWQTFFAIEPGRLTFLRDLNVAHVEDEGSADDLNRYEEWRELEFRTSLTGKLVVAVEYRRLSPMFGGAAAEYAEEYTLLDNGLVLTRSIPKSTSFISLEDAQFFHGELEQRRRMVEQIIRATRVASEAHRAAFFAALFADATARLAELRPDYAPVQLDLTWMCAARQQREEAMKHLHRAIELDPKVCRTAGDDVNLRSALVTLGADVACTIS
ncbi:MAG: hypothetical protein HYV63_09460 [Candidatus Schekmanbacteria bacterium]|nr:hypothetical protein [Candidatus Schekmanbacteria bacterium]